MRRTILLAQVLLLGAYAASAQVPQLMSYQGILRDAAGELVADGDHDLTFKLYDGASTELWSEQHLAVPVSGGLFAVILGGVTPLNLPFDQAYDLGITVDAGTELSPRTPLTAAPYSLNSQPSFTTIATGKSDDQTDNGQILSRVPSFTKHYDDTAVRVSYTDNFRVTETGNPSSARWEVRINGAPAPGEGIFLDLFSSSGNHHSPATIVGYAIGLPAGTHQIEVWVGPQPGAPVHDAYTGYSNAPWVIETQEVRIQ